MPWTQRDAYSHTKKASTPHLQRMWSDVANSALSSHGDEARAIREANAMVAQHASMASKKKMPNMKMGGSMKGPMKGPMKSDGDMT